MPVCGVIFRSAVAGRRGWKMKCTGRRLIAYTLCVVFVSYGAAYLIHAQAPVMPFGLGEVVLPAVGPSAQFHYPPKRRQRLGEGSVNVRSGDQSESTSAAKTRTANTRTDVKTQRKSSPAHEPPASPPPAINDTVPVKHAAGKYVKPKSDMPGQPAHRRACTIMLRTTW